MDAPEDIDAVIKRIRYHGDGLDAMLLAVEYLTKAKRWKAKAEKFDAFKRLYDEHHLSGSKATHRWQTFLLKIHDIFGEP